MLFRLKGLKKIEGQTPETVVLELADTQYKTYASLKNEDVACMPDPIGTHIILITSDGYIPFVKRSDSVEVNKNKIFTFGGFRTEKLIGGAANPALSAAFKEKRARS